MVRVQSLETQGNDNESASEVELNIDNVHPILNYVFNYVKPKKSNLKFKIITKI